MCPVCKRDLAPTLSICLTCGAMMNDTVREELESKISIPVATASGRLVEPMPAVAEPPRRATPEPPPSRVMQEPARKIEKPAPPPASKPIAPRFDTADLRVKKTSPTLVEFQTNKATVPEWRLQLQNSVRQKVGTNRRDGDAEAPQVTQSKPQSTRGANALKVEFVEEDQPSSHANPRVASALKRIEESRRAFSNQSVPEQSLKVGKASPGRNFPFNVVARSNENKSPRANPKTTVNPSPKPMLVSPMKIEKRGFDTNKLPPLQQPKQQSSKLSLSVDATLRAADEENFKNHPKASRIIVEEKAIEVESLGVEAVEADDIEDLAPLSMRFNAGVFDMIIGVFTSFILLSPFIISGGTWLSLSGLLAIAATVAIVMFLYLTISLSFVGRTFGMRLFSLELVDVEENAYPTLHQAAVNSSVFLLSLAFAGVGFLPIFFNEERRAAHDILSGTILLREF